MTIEVNPSISRTTPHLSYIKERTLLSQPGSTKEAYHISLDIKGLDISFTPGDSVCIHSQNDPAFVQRHLDALNLFGEELMIDPRSGAHISARDFFLTKTNLSKLTSKFLQALDIQTQETDLEPLDVLRLAKKPILLKTIAPFFCPLLPRFYSIASSLLAHPDEIHLLIAVPAFTKNEEIRYGVASHFLCHLAQENTPIPLVIHPTPHFSLPHDPTTPLIMIGPGTGVAPFRAFLQERSRQGAPGKNWLIFGERSQASDFYYEQEWREHKNLRLDTAFSRDQSNKIYVQDKLLENGHEVWNWLSNGANLYVCGDAKQMAKSVDAALHHIAEHVGGLDTKEAQKYIKELRKEKRYLADVY